MVADVRGLETGLLGLEGFRLAGTVNKDGEAPAGRPLLCGSGVRAAAGGRRPEGRREAKVSGVACGRAAGGAGAAETPVAAPGVRGEVLDGGQRGGAVSVGAVRTRPPGSSAAGRPRRNAGSCGGSGAGGQLAYRGESRPGSAGRWPTRRRGACGGAPAGEGAPPAETPGPAPAGFCAWTRAGWWKPFRAVLVLRPGASSAASPPETRPPSRRRRWIRGGGVCGRCGKNSPTRR